MLKRLAHWSCKLEGHKWCLKDPEKQTYVCDRCQQEWSPDE